MANRIFLRVGTWYKALEKYLSTDLEITDVVDNPDAEFPEVIGDGGGSPGGSQTLQEVLTEGSVLTGDNTVDAGQNSVIISQLFTGTFIANDVGDTFESYFGVNQGQKSAYMGAYDAEGNQIDLVITPTVATLAKNGVTKNIATILVADDFADDSAAATGLIPVGGLYHTSGVVKVRLV